MHPPFVEGIFDLEKMQIKDKSFEPFIEADKIDKRTEQLANAINADYSEKKPLFLAILNGSFMFASDLMKKVTIPSEISFIKVSSYNNMVSSGHITELIGLAEPIFNRHIVVVEDIVDTGRTMKQIISSLAERGAKSIEVASLLVKPEALESKIEVKYLGFEIPNDFVVGYGLDYDGLGRNLPSIYTLTK